MEIIKAYVDQMFKDLPKTKEVIEMKLNIQDHMEEKFQELVAEGISEAQASKQVINEFGDMDEILKELNIDEKSYQDEISFLTNEDITKYVKWKQVLSVMIGIGVFLCINSVGVMQLLSYYLIGKFGQIVSVCIFFSLIAIAVLIFIFFGMKDESYEEMVKKSEVDYTKKKELEIKYAEAKRPTPIFIAIGVVLCIAAVAFYPLVEYVTMEAIAIFIFFLMISIAVFIFIVAGNHAEVYEKLLKDKKKKAQEERNGGIQGAIMMSATIIFLILGFAFHLWHPGWIVFVVGGMLCGIVATLRKEQ